MVVEEAAHGTEPGGLHGTRDIDRFFQPPELHWVFGARARIGEHEYVVDILEGGDPYRHDFLTVCYQLLDSTEEPPVTVTLKEVTDQAEMDRVRNHLTEDRH